jgi:putative nucleotidyltransferase with HDIG domain
MQDDTRHILESMADTVDMRDPYTGGHSRRVTEFTEAILRTMEKHGPEVDLIISAARVHDIGKIAIPDGILNKPGKLTDEERAIMETHSERGAEVLERYQDFARGVAVVRHHHESWDGTGYPHKLTGTDIPFGARVIAVADSYDAMTSDRPYRTGMSPAKAVSILREGRGVQWDASIVDALVRSLGPVLEESGRPVITLIATDGVPVRVTA